MIFSKLLREGVVPALFESGKDRHRLVDGARESRGGMGEVLGGCCLYEIALWIHTGSLLVIGIFQRKNHYCSQ